MTQKVHRVYTEVIRIDFHDEFEGQIACEDVNDFSDEDTKNIRLTVNDKEVTCGECIRSMRWA